MIPSSRTPEGEPLRCLQCGARNFVDVSTPPGDSVCPNCGTLAWIAEGPEQNPSRKDEIRVFVYELWTTCQTGPSINQIGDYVVSGLTKCLAAYGTCLWMDRSTNSQSTASDVSVVASVGEATLPLFSREVLEKQPKPVRTTVISGRKTLVIDAPIVQHHRIVGGIEVLQPFTSDRQTQRCYFRFVHQVAEMISKCSGMSTSARSA